MGGEAIIELCHAGFWRCWGSVALVHAQNQPGQLKKDRSQPTSGKQEVPPEEDTSLAVKEYSFNPLQAEKELQIGNFYFKTGKYRVRRHAVTEATSGTTARATPGCGWVRREVEDPKAPRKRIQVLALAADAKNAAEIRKKLQRLK